MKTQSWNRLPFSSHLEQFPIADRHAPLPTPSEPMLVYGNGRSYGDVCLNDGGALLRSRGLDRFIAFDPVSGRLQCEAGVLLGEILHVLVPRGWFLPVTPGTRFVTVGGAIANDVHGKNHHDAGSFGDHVLAFELLRSDGSRMRVSREGNAPWFAATVGGLGLTGLITQVELQMQAVANPYMETRSQRFSNLDEFWSLDDQLRGQWPYTVAWVDCLGRQRGRGIYSMGRHAPDGDLEQQPRWREKTRNIPVDPPISLVNGLSLRLFNALYYRQPIAAESRLVHYQPWLYPLDAIQNWNRIYGRKGFYQYQCVLPFAHGRTALSELLDSIAASGQGSFLAVLKTFGEREAPGLLSFVRPGVTLALDFPNQGRQSLKLFERLDAIVSEAGGALYPAKDARMPSAMFRSGFPQWERFSQFVDPAFSSGFWRRVNR